MLQEIWDGLKRMMLIFGVEIQISTLWRTRPLETVYVVEIYNMLHDYIILCIVVFL
jgi:hypothetical protein